MEIHRRVPDTLTVPDLYSFQPERLWWAMSASRITSILWVHQPSSYSPWENHSQARYDERQKERCCYKSIQVVHFSHKRVYISAVRFSITSRTSVCVSERRIIPDSPNHFLTPSLTHFFTLSLSHSLNLKHVGISQKNLQHLCLLLRRLKSSTFSARMALARQIFSTFFTSLLFHPHTH